MKNIRMIVPVLLAGLLCFFMIGCGGAGSGGGGGSTSGNSGRLVDPYIENAIIFVDVDGNGIWNPEITGEIMTTTEGHGPGELPGSFTFTSTPSLGAVIRIAVPGMHLGITYDADLSRKIDGAGSLIISPLTTMLANGFTAEAIRYVLDTYAGININPDDVRDDPMSGLSLTNSDAIEKIRGAICIYALMQIISNESGRNGYFDIATLESSPHASDFQNGLAEMGSAVKTGLTNEVLYNANEIVSTTEFFIRNGLPTPWLPFVWVVDLPPVTATDVANSAFTVTRYVVGQAIENSGSSYTPGVLASTIESLAVDLGMRYYLLANLEHVVVTTSPYGGFQTTLYDAIVSGEVTDFSGNIITSFEVNEDVLGFKVNEFGTIESIDD